jgi:P pilus assembly chaperone PapD
MLSSPHRLHARFRGLSVAPALLAALLGLPGISAAQNGLSIEVAPLRVELKMAPRATHTQPITLRNDSKAPVHARARIDEYWLSQDGTPQFKLATPGEPLSAVAWVRANPSDFTINPGDTATIRVTTVVPADTREGNYRCAVMFEFDPPGLDPRAARKDMQFRGRVATLVYATIGAPKTAVDIDDLQVRLVPNAAPAVVVMLSNTGRGYVRTKGTMVITAPDGRIVREVQVPNAPVLPESKRELAIPTAGPQDTPLEPGRYKVEVRIDVGQAALLVAETQIDLSRTK